MSFIEVKTKKDLNISVTVKTNKLFADVSTFVNNLENKILLQYRSTLGVASSKWSLNINTGSSITGLKDEFKRIEETIKQNATRVIIQQVELARNTMLFYLDQPGNVTQLYSDSNTSILIPALSESYLLRKQKRYGRSDFFAKTGVSKSALKRSPIKVTVTKRQVNVSWNFRSSKFEKFNLGENRQPPRPVLGIFKSVLSTNLETELEKVLKNV